MKLLRHVTSAFSRQHGAGKLSLIPPSHVFNLRSSIETLLGFQRPFLFSLAECCVQMGHLSSIRRPSSHTVRAAKHFAIRLWMSTSLAAIGSIDVSAPQRLVCYQLHEWSLRNTNPPRLNAAGFCPFFLPALLPFVYVRRRAGLLTACLPSERQLRYAAFLSRTSRLSISLQASAPC